MMRKDDNEEYRNFKEKIQTVMMVEERERYECSKQRESLERLSPQMR